MSVTDRCFGVLIPRLLRLAYTADVLVIFPLDPVARVDDVVEAIAACSQATAAQLQHGA